MHSRKRCEWRSDLGTGTHAIEATEKGEPEFRRMKIKAAGQYSASRDTLYNSEYRERPFAQAV